jgi:hypothetical protein
MALSVCVYAPALFDTATRVPLMIKVPWKPGSQGQRTASLSELVDMHPTVAALAGLPHTQPMPLGPGPDADSSSSVQEASGARSTAAVGVPRLEQAFGTDLSPLFDQPYDERRSMMHSEPADPTVTGELLMKNASFSQWPSCGIPGALPCQCLDPRPLVGDAYVASKSDQYNSHLLTCHHLNNSVVIALWWHYM